MKNKIEELIKRVNSLEASHSVLEHLALSLFDAIENKQCVIKQFSDTTQLTAETIDSKTAQAYLVEFLHNRSLLLKFLAGATKEPTNPQTALD